MTHSLLLPDSRKHNILSILPREVPLKQASNLNVYLGDLPTFGRALQGTVHKAPLITSQQRRLHTSRSNTLNNSRAEISAVSVR